MDTLVLIGIVEKPRPKYKKYPYKVMEIDKEGAFFGVPGDVVYTKYVRKYTHDTIFEVDHMKFKELRDKLLNDHLKIVDRGRVLIRFLDGRVTKTNPCD